MYTVSRLLTLALVETTRNQSMYAVAAYDIDDDCWVYLKEIPTEEFTDDSGDSVWDIFTITEADYVAYSSRARPGNSKLVSNCKPKVASQVKTQSNCVTWLEEIDVYSVRHDI